MTTPFPVGRHRMNYAAYNAVPAIRISDLLHMRTSPKHYRHHRANKSADTAAMALGRATHTAVYEPDLFPIEYAVWDGAPRNTKAGKDEWAIFQSANAGKTILDAEDYAHCLRLRDAVREDPVARSFLDEPGAEREVTYLWRDGNTGLPCKARIDWMCSAIVDLKTTRHSTPSAFGRQAASLSYYVRASFYYAAVLAVTGARIMPAFIAVEKGAPHDVVVYRMTGDQLRAGADVYAKLLERVAECQRVDRWPGVGGGEVRELFLPDWVYGGADNSLLVDGEEQSI